MKSSDASFFSARLRCKGLMSEKWSAVYRETNGLKLNAVKSASNQPQDYVTEITSLQLSTFGDRTTTTYGMSRLCQRRRLGHVDGSPGHISNYATDSAPRQTL